jgi:hypothetical protein
MPVVSLLVAKRPDCRADANTVFASRDAPPMNLEHPAAHTTRWQLSS